MPAVAVIGRRAIAVIVTVLADITDAPAEVRNGTNRTSSDVCYSVAIGGRPDMAQTANSVENDPNRTFVAARIVNSVDPITFGANSAHHKGDEFIQPRVVSRLCKPQFAGSSLLRNLPHQ